MGDNERMLRLMADISPMDPRSKALLLQSADEIAKKQKALATLAKYFTSGNCIPVDQATIKAADFWQITGMVPNAEVTSRPPLAID